MIKYIPIIRSSDLILEGNIFKEKPRWNLTKAVLLVSILAFLSCSYQEETVTSADTITVPVYVKTNEDKLVEYIHSQNKTISESEVQQIVAATFKWSNHFKVDPNLLVAIQQVESGFNKFSISSGGALGILQIIPSWHLNKLKTATKELGTPEIFDNNVNIYVGAWILKDCMKKFAGQTNVLRCYSGSNATPNGYEDKVKSSLTTIKKFVSV